MRNFLGFVIIFLVCLPISGAGYRTSTFSIAILPDTQYYSRDNATMFDAQTQWVVDHTQENNILFTAHLGDVVHQTKQRYEWENANFAISTLEAYHMPYSILAGNHDLLNQREYDDVRDRDKEPFSYYFPIKRIQNQPTYGGHSPSQFNSYHLIEADGLQFLILALDWRMSDESFLWVQKVLDKHPYVPTILTTHDLANANRDGEIYLTRYGQTLWNNIITSNQQIFLTINGHHHNVGHTIFKNDYGRDVLVMLVNFQSDYNGGNGMMRLLTFDIGLETIHATTLSPYVMSIPPDHAMTRTPNAKPTRITNLLFLSVFGIEPKRLSYSNSKDIL